VFVVMVIEYDVSGFFVVDEEDDDVDFS